MTQSIFDGRLHPNHNRMVTLKGMRYTVWTMIRNTTAASQQMTPRAAWEYRMWMERELTEYDLLHAQERVLAFGAKHLLLVSIFSFCNASLCETVCNLSLKISGTSSYTLVLSFYCCDAIFGHCLSTVYLKFSWCNLLTFLNKWYLHLSKPKCGRNSPLTLHHSLF